MNLETQSLKKNVVTLHQDGSGLLNVEEFDDLIYDLTNFLTYVGEQVERKEKE